MSIRVLGAPYTRIRTTSPRRRQSGVALIVALLVVALAALAAASMMERQNIDVRRTANIIHSDQAYLYANAAEVFAKEVLKHDETKDTDDRAEPWFQPLPPTEVEGGSIGGYLRDQEANFPLNMLVNDDGTINDDYRNVLINLLTDLGVQNSQDVAANIVEWIDANDSVDKGGMEDMDYLNLPHPYRTGNTEMVSLSELRLIGGLDEKGDTMARLLGLPIPESQSASPSQNPVTPRNEPYFNVLPKKAGKGGKIGININSAPIELIMSLNSAITKTAAEAWITERNGDDNGTKPYKDPLSFINFLAASMALADDNSAQPPKKDKTNFVSAMKKIHLTATSEFFEMTATAQIGDSLLTMKSLLHRVENNAGGPGNSSTEVVTIRRGLGEY